MFDLLEDTGERIIPDLMKRDNWMYLEHLARYYFATPYVKGRVLDIACGSGYGTHFVAKMCKHDCEEIVGVDIDADTIQYATKRYQHPLVTYQKGDVLSPTLVQEIGQFDTVMSFETLEHVRDEKQFVKQMYNLLKPGGALILSTPFGKGRDKTCCIPFHYFQLTREEFEALFRNAPFERVQFYEQRGVTFEQPRAGVKYNFGIVVAKK